MREEEEKKRRRMETVKETVTVCRRNHYNSIDFVIVIISVYNGNVMSRFLSTLYGYIMLITSNYSSKFVIRITNRDISFLFNLLRLNIFSDVSR